MRKTGIMMAAVCLLAIGFNGSAGAVSFSKADLYMRAALSEKTAAHPSGNFGAGGAMAGNSLTGYEYSWGLSGKSSGALVFISTDHVSSASDLFSLVVTGFDELTSSWITGGFSGKVYKVAAMEPDADDFAMRFDFSSAVSKIGVNSQGTMGLSDSAATYSGAEFDGVAAVPEPSTLLLIVGGLAGFAFFRKRIRA